MTDLADYGGDAYVSSSVDEETVLSAADLRKPPATLTCGSLVMKPGAHGYGHALFDVIHVQAPRETYRHLGVLLLATVFHRTQVEIVLTHEHSTVKSFVLEEAWIVSRPKGYAVQPESFTYWPEERKRHPWMHVDPNDMPKLNFDRDVANSVADTAKVIDSSCDRGRILLGELLLDVGRKETVLDEYHLESECGYRGVGPGSAEVSIWLPGSIGFDQEVMDK